MLEYLRNASEKPIAKVLITILAFSFIGWGVAEWIFGGGYSDTTLVRVGRTSISAQQFSSEKSRELAQMSREEMRAVYADPDASAAFQTKIMGHLTSQAMVENRADDLGFVVSDARIAREIREFPEFQVNGAFSSAQFDAVLNASGFSEADFAAYLRAQILRSYVLGAMSVPVPVANFAATAAYNARYATRDIEYVTVPFSEFAAEEPTDDELREFYAAHPRTIAEVRNVSYVLVPAAMDKPDSYSAGYDQIIKIEDDIIAGETLANAATKHDAKYVDMGTFDAAHAPADDVISDKIVSRIFTMDEASESEIIETKSGFVIVRVNTVTPAHNAEFADVRGDLMADWAHDAARKQAYVRANELLGAVNGGDKLAGGHAASVTRANGAPLQVLNTAFAAPVGTNTIAESPDAFYVVSVKSESMPTIDAAQMASIKTDVQNLSTHGVMDDYNAFLGRKYPVKVNEKVYKRFMQQ